MKSRQQRIRLTGPGFSVSLTPRAAARFAGWIGGSGGLLLILRWFHAI